MASDFHANLRKAEEDLDESWDSLLKLVADLRDEDLHQGNRGEWTVGAILHHLWASQWGYRHLVRQLRSFDNTPLGQPPAPANSVAEIEQCLVTARGAMKEAIEGIDEETFYNLRDTDHHQEYSVKSVLADNARHNREHVGQIAEVLDSST